MNWPQLDGLSVLIGEATMAFVILVGHFVAGVIRYYRDVDQKQVGGHRSTQIQVRGDLKR